MWRELSGYSTGGETPRGLVPELRRQSWGRVNRAASHRGERKLHRHTKKQKNISNKKENRTIETDPEMTWKIDLVDKDSKTIDVIILRMIKKGEESISMLRRDM